MSQPLLIRAGRLIDPASARDETADLCVRDGKIVPELTSTERNRAQTIDADGLVVCPGLIDIHVHFREPGQTHKETIGTGSRAAAAGGFTTVVCMPNTTPPADNPGTIRRINDAIARDAVVRVLPTGCLTVGMDGQQLAPIGSLLNEGIVAVTDDGRCVQNNEIMRRAVEYASMFGLPILDHCQDASMTGGAVVHEGHWSLRLGLKGWPAAAEDIIIGRNVILARHTRARIHMQHVSSAYGVDILRRARKRGLPVSGEATPHHLFFTDAACADYDTRFKMNPPLRSESDRRAIIEGYLDGSLDILATDHAPHTRDEKDCEFDYAPFGIIGLETALPATLEVLHYEANDSLSHILAGFTSQPARLLGLPGGSLLPGQPADITLFDPSEKRLVNPTTFQSKATNCPWNGRQLRGAVKRTIVAGRTVWDGHQILDT